MNILKIAIVSNTDMMKNYKECREKAENLDKIIILKNNQPDAVLFSITKYEKLSVIFEYIESLDEDDLTKFIQDIPKEGIVREKDTIEQLIKDAQKNGEILVDEIGRFTQEMHEENKYTHKKMDDIKKEVVDGNEKIINNLKETSENISKEINKQ